VSKVLKGIGVVEGTVMGKVKVIAQDVTQYLAQYHTEDPEREAEKFLAALDEAGNQLTKIMEKAKQNGADEQAAIMEAHIAMLDDPMLKEAVVQKVKDRVPAPQAILETTGEYADMFASMDDQYLRARAADVRDIGSRVARILLGVCDVALGKSPVILCAQDIDPSMLADVAGDTVQGLVLGQGSTTSHVVIIAKARGLAAVVGVPDVQSLTDGTEIILDGNTGEILVWPGQSELDSYTARIREEQERKIQALKNSSQPAVTLDGVRIQLAANISNPGDMDLALKYGCEGVGLYRTEFLFMGRNIPPSEDEQFQAYRQVAEKCGNHLCVIRTMDIGGDKPASYLDIGKEPNPFLGWRGIRISLVRTELFIAQLKAILRAGVYGRVAIMFPMIVNVGEIRRARECLAQAIGELEKEEKEFARNVPVGIMVETPAAAVMASSLAKECDFFSIGTNDLVQYTLAVDRGNQKVSNLYSHFHPAVLQLIASVIRAAHENNIWAAICGEMASDPQAALLLMGMGIDELSMAATAIPKVKEQMAVFTMNEAQKLSQQALALNESESIRNLFSGISGKG
jgi:phosphotransferase system enzyme I (PtsI)